MRARIRLNVALGILTLTANPSCGSSEGNADPIAPTPIEQRGSIRITTEALGDPLSADPDGFSVIVDEDRRSVATIGSMLFSDLVIGNHFVALEDAADHCAISGENPRQITVLSDQVTLVEFAITCTDWTLPVVVRTLTRGTDLDPNGYTVSLDGGEGMPIGINDTLTFSNVGTGRHEVLLSGLDGSCGIPTSPNPRILFLSSGVTGVQLNYNVFC